MQHERRAQHTRRHTHSRLTSVQLVHPAVHAHLFSPFVCAMYAESDVACGGNSEDPDTPTQSDGEDREEEPVAPLASTSEDLGSDLEASTGRVVFGYAEDRTKTRNGNLPLLSISCLTL